MISPNITESNIIPGVLTAQLQAHTDDRGQFAEVFRKGWFPHRTWDAFQMNHSVSQTGVLRGLHYHFHQVDYWYLVKGIIRVGLADLRRDSMAFMQTHAFDFDSANKQGLFIPTGVAHGFLALTDAILFYIVDNYYDSQDEHGLAWNDPDVRVDWRPQQNPILSGRDVSNPLFREIPLSSLPK
jgi:dTDP-4-dehydrorhamnose 3,5-epimerase